MNDKIYTQVSSGGKRKLILVEQKVSTLKGNYDRPRIN